MAITDTHNRRAAGSSVLCSVHAKAIHSCLSYLGISGRHLPLKAPTKWGFSASLEIFQGAHRSAICTQLSTFTMHMIIQLQNCAGNKQKLYKIIMNMFALQDKAKPNIEIIRGLNLAVVQLMNIQVTNLLL
jgi:hypothetical protein